MSEKLPSVITTQGGSVVGGDVITNGGDFIGHDKNVYISAETVYDVAGLPNPYLGLRSFVYRDRLFYTGRDREIADAVKQITTSTQANSLLFITGASGSGKSSFAQAGLVPALEEYYQQRHFSVQFAVFRPTVHPVAMLKDALLQLGIPSLESLLHTPPSQVNLLVIDQFEELFTQSDHAEKAVLCEWLAQLPSLAQARTLVLITVRSDYLSELAEIPALWPRAKEAVVFVSIKRKAGEPSVGGRGEQVKAQTEAPPDEVEFGLIDMEILPEASAATGVE